MVRVSVVRQKKYSDWDFHILVDQTIDKKTKDEIKDCLYDIELEYNEILSSIMYKIINIFQEEL
jgi:hypothetical protein